MTEAMFSDFTHDERELIIRLPYRVGMWMSQVDSSGGEAANTAEREALETIVMSYAEDFLKSEFVQRVMEQTLARRNEWTAWTSHLSQVPDECRRAVAMLGPYLSSRDVNAFKHNLFDIATAVAVAFREEEEARSVPILGWVMAAIRSLFRRAPVRDPYVSSVEQRALEQLAVNLGLDLRVMLGA